MTATAIGLTDTKIKGLKAPDAGQVEHPDKLVAGLRLRIGSSGTKTFILRKRVGGRVRNITLGRYHDRRFTLGDARKKARILLNDIEGGANPAPAARKKGGAANGTVGSLFDQYRVEVDKLRSGPNVTRIFELYILPDIGDRLADSITRADVTELVDRVANDPIRPKPAMATAVGAQLSAFYKWALPVLPRLESNPCRDARKPTKAKPRERVLIDKDNRGRDEELRALWRVSDTKPMPWGPAIKLLILTAARRSEVFNADWSEFDLNAKVWVIPRSRAKNDVEHVIPLSDAAVAVLDTIPKVSGTDKLFPARSNTANGVSGFSKSWAGIVADVEKELGHPVERFGMHDVRRSAATGLQRVGVKLEVVEAILNHVSGSRGGLIGTYQRHAFAEEKRNALTAWAAEVERIVSGRERGNVVALKGGGR